MKMIFPGSQRVPVHGPWPARRGPGLVRAAGLARLELPSVPGMAAGVTCVPGRSGWRS